MLETYIEKYVAQGFKIFPCKPYPDKTPMTTNGFKDAHSDLIRLKKIFWKKNGLIGLPTGRVNGFVVVDIDSYKDKQKRTNEEIIEHIEDKYKVVFPDTFAVNTGSGGLHLYYKIVNETIKSGSKVFKDDDELPVDTRGEGGYVIAPNYKEYVPREISELTNIISEMAEIPDWLIELRAEKNIVKKTIKEKTIEPSEIIEIRSALAAVNADDRETWINVGMALKSTNAGEQAFGLWTEWSQKSDKFDMKDQTKRWETLKPSEIGIASIFHIAKQNGWISTYIGQKGSFQKKEKTTIKENDCEEIEIEEIKERQEKSKIIAPVFPPELLVHGGLIGEIIEYINQTAIRQLPELSYGAALSFVGALMGRRYEIEGDGTRTNLYVAGIAESGWGKENQRQCIRDICHAVDNETIKHICGTEDITSDSAIYSELVENQSQVFLLDEFSSLLQRAKNGKDPHAQSIITAFLKLYSSPNKVIYGKSYADSRKKLRIDNPHLCLYATAVPKMFYNSLNRSLLEDGFLSRFLIFEHAGTERPRRNTNRIAGLPPSGIIEQVSHIWNTPTNHEGKEKTKLSHSLLINPYPVKMSRDAIKLYEEYETMYDKTYDMLYKENSPAGIYNRAGLSTKKIALMFAVCEDVFNPAPVIDARHIDIGAKTVIAACNTSLYAAKYKISDSEHEQESQFVFSIIRKNGFISAAELTEKTIGLRSSIRKEVIEGLKESNRISEFFKKEGRKSLLYYMSNN